MNALKIAALGFAVATTAQGAIGVVESTGQFNINSTTTYHSNPGVNPALPADLGTFDPGDGDVLTLNNWYFENYAYNSGGGDTQFENNWLDGSSTATINITIDSVLNSYSLTNTLTSGNNKKWALNPGTPIDLSGLGNGEHTLSITVDYTYNWWDGAASHVGTSSGNGPASTTFEIIPESSAALLGALGLLGILRRRR